MQTFQEKTENMHVPGISRELFRKSLHMLIAFIPFIASISFYLSIYILGFFIIFYSFSELMRKQGFNIVVVSDITRLASRKRDAGKFVLGPVTLFSGAMAALLIFPRQIAYFAIFAMAFGDGFSSIIGKSFGTMHLPFTGGKTLEGSFACFAMVFIIGYKMSMNFTGSLYISFMVALIEAIPSGDFDNIIIPVAAGVGSASILF